MEWAESNSIGWLFKIGATILSIGICCLAHKKFKNIFVTIAVFLVANIILLELVKMMGIHVPLPGRL
jgi:uncharacterized membrane protein YesL